jgi:glycerol-3-phosphate dehydrogenase
VHYTWAGLRALVRVEGVQEGKVSRKHKVLDHQTREGLAGIVSVVGGKITAYRSIAEEVGDLATRKLGRPLPGYTDRRPYPGGALRGASNLEAYVERELWPRAAALGLGRETTGRLGRLYGSLAQELLDLIEADRGLARPLAPGKPAVMAELVRAVRREWALSLADYLLRRSDLGLLADQALDSLEPIAQAMGELCGWDAAERAEQVARYRAEIEPMRRLSTNPAPAGAARSAGAAGEVGGAPRPTAEAAEAQPAVMAG